MLIINCIAKLSLLGTALLYKIALGLWKIWIYCFIVRAFAGLFPCPHEVWWDLKIWGKEHGGAAEHDGEVGHTVTIHSSACREALCARWNQAIQWVREASIVAKKASTGGPKTKGVNSGSATYQLWVPNVFWISVSSSVKWGHNSTQVGILHIKLWY